MAQFWLGTFDVKPPLHAKPSPAAPILATGTRMLAIEVVREGAEFAVLFSTVDDLQEPRRLTCRLAFANGCKTCNIWRDRGFPLVDARITCRGKSLQVISPYFPGVDSDPSNEMQYEVAFLTITGIEFAPQQRSKLALSTQYDQFHEAPDSATPATWITRQAVTWTPSRWAVQRLSCAGVMLDLASARSPSLAPFESGHLEPQAVWCGMVDVATTASQRQPERNRVSRADTFGVPAFRFENVEVLGFRIDLGKLGIDYEQGLADLIAPLNFHLGGSAGAGAAAARRAISDFRYRPATRTLLIELIRYGRMKLMSPSAPLVLDDYQCQHELLVRVLVGRVDDDTSQARAPAVYVPAIFVDNPWSKIVGRDVQGFDKRLVDFCISQEGKDIARLCPDGRVADSGHSDSRPVADLAAISRIRLVDMMGSSDGGTVLDLDCSPQDYENWDEFDSVDLQLAVGSSNLGGTRWRQSDFDEPEFRRSFARSAVAENLRGFRSIQVSPVSSRGDMEKTWISGTFKLDDDVQIARPSGLVRLTAHPQPNAPKHWNVLCKMLGGDGNPSSVSFSTGEWYRLKCAMELTVDGSVD
jgi:hypothetical protein